VYNSHTICVESCTVRQRQFQLQLAYDDVTTLARSHRALCGNKNIVSLVVAAMCSPYCDVRIWVLNDKE
jgi:hypothetical protein